MGIVAVEDANEAAVDAVATAVAVDTDAANAVLDVVVVARGCDRKAGVVLCRAVDAAGDGEVLDGGIIEAIERSTLLVAIAFRTGSFFSFV